MRSSGSPSDRLSDDLCSRLNARLAFRLLLAWMGIASLILLSIATVYFIQGYSLPVGWYGVSGLIMALGATILGWRHRVTRTTAMQFADRHFSLKDAVISCQHFRAAGLTDGFYALQAEQTDRQAETLDPTAIRLNPPRWLWTCSLLLAACALLAGFRRPSLDVQQLQKQQQLTAQWTQKSQQALETLVNQLDEEVTNDQERDLLDLSKLKEWVNALQQTNHQTDALRQLASLERKLQQASLNLLQKRDEQLLQQAAQQLERAEQAPELAQQLKSKDYDGAAQELAQHTPNAQATLAEQLQQMSKLKAMAQHLAAAAELSKQPDAIHPQPPKPTEEMSHSRNNPTSDAMGQDQQPSKLAQAMADLEQAASDGEKSLQEATQQQQQLGAMTADMTSRCQASSSAAASQLESLARQLKKMSMQQRTQKRLNTLSRACSMFQSGMSQGNVASQQPGRGGKPPGLGTSNRRNDAQKPLLESGQSAQLTGMTRAGESETEVEAADSGSGVARRSHDARTRTFRTQVESFVMREDVPEDVRNGVQNYFEAIHHNQLNEQSSPNPSSRNAESHSE